MIGEHLKTSDNLPSPVAWRFLPKRRGIRITVDDLERELFDYGMSGNMYALLLPIPEEYPGSFLPHIDLYEPEDACRILADWCHYTLLDATGKVLVGVLPAHNAVQNSPRTVSL